METILEKISSYNLFNNLFPGAIFILAGNYYIGWPTPGSIIDSIFVYYFAGMAISRFGSIAIKPFLQLFRIVPSDKYNDYLIAEKVDQKLEALSSENNIYRSLVAAFALLLVIKISMHYVQLLPQFKENLPDLTICGLFILFVLAFRKQNRYISERVEQAVKKNS